MCLAFFDLSHWGGVVGGGSVSFLFLIVTFKYLSGCKMKTCDSVIVRSLPNVSEWACAAETEMTYVFAWKELYTQ